MPCKNPECDRRKMSEGELIQATIETLRRIAGGPFTHEVITCLDVDKPCVRCSCNQIADWLQDYLASCRQVLTNCKKLNR